MTFADITAGERLFLDANVFIYHYSADTNFGGECCKLLQLTDSGGCQGFTATHILTEVAHRLMTQEAIRNLNWPMASVGKKLKQNLAAMQSLTLYKTSVSDILASNIQILAIDPLWILRATQISDTYGLLSNDALTVAAMEANGIIALASNDSDFDRVPGITRYQHA